MIFFINGIGITGLWQLFGAIVNVVGSLIILSGSAPLNYRSFFTGSLNSLFPNGAVFQNSLKQAVSTLFGTIVIFVGFVEIAISYLPNSTGISSFLVMVFLFVVNSLLVGVAIFSRKKLILFYSGIRLIGTSTSVVVSDDVRCFMKNEYLQLGNRVHSEILLYLSWRKPSLWHSIANIPNLQDSDQKLQNKELHFMMKNFRSLKYKKLDSDSFLWISAKLRVHVMTNSQGINAHVYDTDQKRWFMVNSVVQLSEEIQLRTSSVQGQ